VGISSKAVAPTGRRSRFEEDTMVSTVQTYNALGSRAPLSREK